MRFIYVFLGIIAAFALAGCEQQEAKSSKTEPHQVVKPQEKIDIEGKTQSAVTAAQEVVKETQKRASEMAEEAKSVANETVQAVDEKTADMVAEVKAAVPSTAVVTPMTTTQESTAVEAAYPEVIVLKASYGNITFPHGQHIEALDCSTCHDDVVAGFDITKDVAHKLCKGCHKDGGAGPTGCKDCHKK